MARVTVEDCIDKVSSQFELVLIGAKRARDISAGARLTMERGKDKNPVLALREIAEGTIEVEDLRNNLVRGLQKHAIVESQEVEDDEELMSDPVLSSLLNEENEGAAATEVQETQASEEVKAEASESDTETESVSEDEADKASE